MDILRQIVVGMNRKDVKNYKIYASRLIEKNGRKDIALFESIRKAGEKFNDEIAFEKLYSEGKDRNSFYQLKNRLAEDINLSIFLQEHDENEAISALYTASLGYHYLQRNDYRLALHYLKKAEKKAKKLENHALLDLIYSRMIHITQETFFENPEDYLKKRKDNSALLHKITELENTLQAIEYRVKISQNLSHSDIRDLLKLTIDQFSTDQELKDSPKLQFGVYVIMTRRFLKDNNFKELEEYLIPTYEDFKNKKLFNKSNHSVKLEILSWIANACFKNKKYHLSLEYAEQLKSEMERFDKFLYERFEFFYYNSLVINFSVINPSKAIDILLELTKKEKMTKLHFQGVFVYLNLAVLYYMQKEYSPALKYLSRLYAYEGFKNTEVAVQLKITLGELMMRYDLNELETLEYRMKQIVKSYKEELSANAQSWEGDFIEFIGLLTNPEARKGHNMLQTKAKGLMEKIRASQNSESMLFRYDQWVGEKARIF
jgi:tetratricopeptide (TPR) repeat protein